MPVKAIWDKEPSPVPPKRILKNNGVHVVSATEVISDGPEGILLESLLEGMAEYYSADLSETMGQGTVPCPTHHGTGDMGQGTVFHVPPPQKTRRRRDEIWY